MISQVLNRKLLRLSDARVHDTERTTAIPIASAFRVDRTYVPWYFPMSIMILVPYRRKSKQSKQFKAISYPCTTLVTCDTQLEAVGDTELL